MSENNLERKSFSAFEIKDESTGEVGAIVCTLGVVDKEGDVFLPGSFPHDAKVKLSAYGHDALTSGAPPVGKGSLSEQGDKVVFKGRFFLSTTRGMEAFHTVKELGDEGEWSFGWPTRATKMAPMTDEWRAKGARRLITGISPIEASPVFQGASWGTGTLYTKDVEEPDPAIEAARLETERKAAEDAETARIDAERKAKIAEEHHEFLRRRFDVNPPAGVK